VQVFLDNEGSNLVATIPPFTNANSSLLAVLPAPFIPKPGRVDFHARRAEASERRQVVPDRDPGRPANP